MYTFTEENLIALLTEVQTDALYADGCYCNLTNREEDFLLLAKEYAEKA